MADEVTPGEAVQHYADPAMFEAQPIEKPGEITVHLVNATVDPLGSLAAACMMYDGKPQGDRSAITDEQRYHYWQQANKTHLKAPFEFIHLHFMLEGVTRGFTHQMVRQRTAVYAQESMRFAVKEQLADEVPLPPSLAELPDKDDRRGVWQKALYQIEGAYQFLLANGVPAEDARGLLPTATPTRLHYGTNLRGLLEHAGNRLCTQAQFEWRVVLAKMMEAMLKREEWYEKPRQGVGLFPEEPTINASDAWQWRVIVEQAFQPVCFTMGRCPFNAEFDRGCKIKERVNEGRFSEIAVEEWLMDPKAAR